ncbi:MAG TPA: hypothetical protein PLV62_12990, partial [Spirochaetota bacterium]|nr:hypothetical protein [Spirochaetota bacterium]
ASFYGDMVHFNQLLCFITFHGILIKHSAINSSTPVASFICNPAHYHNYRTKQFVAFKNKTTPIS